MKTDLASRLRSLRAEAALTQAEVAQKLGISQQTYSKYENSDCGIDSKMIVAICSLYGVTSDYLLGIDDGGRGKKQDVSQTKADANINDLLAQLLTQMKK